MGSSINHVVKFLGIFEFRPPSPFMVTFNKYGVYVHLKKEWNKKVCIFCPINSKSMFIKYIIKSISKNLKSEIRTGEKNDTHCKDYRNKIFHNQQPLNEKQFSMFDVVKCIVEIVFLISIAY